MRRFHSTIIWGLAALVCIVFLSFQSQAAEFRFGPGDHYDNAGNICALDGTILVNADGTVVQDPFHTGAGSKVSVGAKIGAAVSQPTSQPNYTVEETKDGKVYTFEGKKYVKSSFYGQHRLTGYAAQETGNAGTFSGKTAKSAHTVAAPSDLPIGTVIIVEGVEGPYPERYNGLYVVEDRGGNVLESQGLIDIFCDSIEESERITAAGWNAANVWIAAAK